jgi:DNA invertase Pin-like site-specific DNA recombinase
MKINTSTTIGGFFMMYNYFEQENINDMPIRVTFYARASSNKNAPINHLDDQIAICQEFINSRPNWISVEGYIDENSDADTVAKRERFNQMMEDAKNGSFDLVVTKDVSCFSRDYVKSLEYAMELLKNGVYVIFQNDGISTKDYKDRMCSLIWLEQVLIESQKIREGRSSLFRKD